MSGGSCVSGSLISIVLVLVLLLVAWGDDGLTLMVVLVPGVQCDGRRLAMAWDAAWTGKRGDAVVVAVVVVMSKPAVVVRMSIAQLRRKKKKSCKGSKRGQINL